MNRLFTNSEYLKLSKKALVNQPLSPIITDKQLVQRLNHSAGMANKRMGIGYIAIPNWKIMYNE